MKPLFVLCFFILGIFSSAQARTPGELLGEIAVQDGGRIKPYDTFARESLELIYGKEVFNGKAATEVVFTWFLLPDHWEGVELFQIRRASLKENIQLDKQRTLFARKELVTNERLPLIFQDLDNRLQNKEKLDPYWQDVQRLRSQLGLFQAVASGEGLRWAAPVEGDTWIAVPAFSGDLREKFVLVTKDLPGSLGGEASADLTKSVEDFRLAARGSNPSFSDLDIKAEIHLNTFHPFRWAWMAYLLAAFSVVFLMLRPDAGIQMKAAWFFFILGFLLHTYGFGLRIYLTGRPPVSNMYETVVWVPWGTVLFAGIFELLYRKRLMVLGGSLVAVLCLVIADMAPTILDSSLTPLEPVLRSNYWLTIHVLTITISYSAFFLALILGDIGLVRFLRGTSGAQMQEMAFMTYRVLQIGVVLLAAGTILGGIWADYSWGRFWGWDPKETWALIALLGYLALLHARRAGYVKEFGLLAGSAVAFSLVVMAWYGVNYVLGAGLHSYGFGGGGVTFVSALVGAQIVFVIFCLVVRRSQLRP